MATLSEKDKQYLLSLKPEDITYTLLVKLFADKAVKENGKVKIIKSRMNSYDTFELKPNEYFNKEKVKTNAGLFIYNKLIVERSLSNVLGYINIPINKSVLENIDDQLSEALLNNKITVDDMVRYLDHSEWLAMKLHAAISGSFTMKSLKPIPSVIKERDKLLKENKDRLENGEVEVAVNIEKILLDKSKEELKGDPGMYLYDSGARGSFGNNFKNISVMKGPVFDPVSGKFDIVQTNFMEGINKEDIPSYGNAIITGAYPKAVGTKVSGYFSKQIIAALQAVTLDGPNSDCGTKGYAEVTISPFQKKDYLYRYIIENGKLVLLEPNNIDKYINKSIKLRSPQYCVGDKICRKCAGLIYEKLAINNIGLTAARVSSTLLNLSMKKFHDATVKISKIDKNSISL